MGILDHQKELYFDICQDYVYKRFGREPGLGRVPDRTFLTATMVTPEDGGKVVRFNESDLLWEDSGCVFTNWSIAHDGKVFVDYSDGDVDDDGMVFRVGHPREVSELFYLLVQPMSYFEAAVFESISWKLGDLVNMYVLIPMGDGWRGLDLAHLPSNMPPEFWEMLGRNLVQNSDSIGSDQFCEAGKFAERWPEFISALPDAVPFLRAGYLADKYLNLRHALDWMVVGPRANTMFLKVLFVPSRDDISALYLREYLNGDRKAANQLRAAFAEENELGKVHDMLKNVTIRMPAALTDQIRLAAQLNLMRQRVLHAAAIVAHERAPFGELTSQYRDATRAIKGFITARNGHA